jgi:hypothetical protein
MPTRKLSDLFVERAKAPARDRLQYFDAAFPGLAFRITDKGGKLVDFLPLQWPASPVHDRALSCDQAGASAKGSCGGTRACARGQ